MNKVGEQSRMRGWINGFTSYLANLPLRYKIMYSSLAVILLVSVSIAFLARYILIASLTTELENRGLGVGHSIADRCPSLILINDRPNMTSLVFDAAEVGVRKELIAYIFIQSLEGEVLAHSFLRPFPQSLVNANPIPEDEESSVRLVQAGPEDAYDIAVPVWESEYRIGSVHVGLSKLHIDNVVSKLRLVFLGFLGMIVIIMIFISDKLSRNITRPIAQLIHLTDQVSRDNLDVSVDLMDRVGCWEIVGCEQEDCPAFRNERTPCWHLDDTLCEACAQASFPDKLETCSDCQVFKQEAGDEIVQLADSFKHMIEHIKDYRDELRRSQQKYRSLFHSGPDPIFVLDCERFVILDANPMATEVYGYSRKELVGMPFRKLGPDFTQVCMREFSMGDETSLAGCVFYPKMLSYRENGEPFYVNAHACGTIYEENPAIIVSTNDITDMIEKDAQLIQASKMKSLGEMSAGIAHEVNQPLNAIKIGSEFLNLASEKGGAVPVAHLSRVAREISDQVDRAADIISTMREFGRKSELSREKLDINKPVRGVMNILGQQIALENIELVLDLGEDLPPVLAQKNRIEQVLFNLITNARDAINMGGGARRAITIRSHADNGTVNVCVEDTGIGLAEEQLQKIFEPFYTTKEIGRGMGLGLAISYDIVKDYHGDITVSSQPGRGTAFCIALPAA